MSDETPVSTGQRRLWLWFLVGFVVTFLGMCVVWPMYFYDGRAVYKTALWHYYLLEAQLALTSSGALGPTSGNLAAALTTAAEHIAFSAFIGAIAMAVVWLLRKRRRPA
jgi:hypothetical protein